MTQSTQNGSIHNGPSQESSTPAETDLVTVHIDGVEVNVPKGTLVIRAAELIGVQIPRFCDHPLLEPAGACRQCLVEVEGQRKPLASCTTTVSHGMEVRTQMTSPVADKAQKGVMELLLINHPLDCPVCDKGGECPLQNQAMSNGQSESRFTGEKRTFPKPINISSQVLLDRERCVLCARCTRFSDQIAGDPFIELQERGALQQVGIYANEPFESYFSGNTVQICPVGALTGAAYRFRARPFDLVSSPSVCEHCASGCSQRTDHRRGKVLRRLAGDDPEVNEEWNCDKGRWAFTYAAEPDRFTTPMVRGADGELHSASWSEALTAAAEGLTAAGGKAGVLVGGRVTQEDAYGYAKFARMVLNTNDVDFRARAHSDEEAHFLTSHVAAGAAQATYAEVENSSAVLLVGFEPEEESPIVFLRLRKAARKKQLPIFSVAPYASPGLKKVSGTLLSTTPGGEAEVLDGLNTNDPVFQHLTSKNAVIIVGERLAAMPGSLSAACRLAERTGAALVWIPRRAGERGALNAGAFPHLLPGGRPVTDSRAAAEVRELWGASALPDRPGRDTDSIVTATIDGTLTALLVGGVDPYDLPHPRAALSSLDTATFVVSLELRPSAVTERAHVVFPVASVAEKQGTFLNWEGRPRQFDAALKDAGTMPDVRILHALAGRMGVPLGLPDVSAARDEIRALGTWNGDLPATPTIPPGTTLKPKMGEAVLATWRMLLDEGSLQDGEPHLAGTARTPVVRLSKDTAAEIGASHNDAVTVRSRHGAITLPLAVTDMPSRVVWLPQRSAGCAVYKTLGVDNGSVVEISVARSDGDAL
ncbi:NADH-quinone oxidoreductase subunit G [Hoyosella rhizosphaerae]|uniref:NADH-quinone oxidoreductase n=1 Tax=Hoyosella rhizosphaerae TaxID=1755582 RepID=A0A916U6P2_9ACTN|nr:NADH-quinone oxidoreductase subunit G [Hoyosella rhizosphaerae]MBN4926219.1 NADH-quinone oxidoreductase subunit G [Hoyosella rhizosphaerae]GGC61123.1 NADH-quinone oxidoreductase subunit G [Hoyosella rhizosphaerae]